MIENKELGLKMAENPEEAAWSNLKDKLEMDTASMKRGIEMNEVLLKFIDSKLKGGGQK